MIKKIIVVSIILIILCFILVYLGLSGFFTKMKYDIKPSELNYYHGVVVDLKGNPIDSVKVSILKSNYSAFTNRRGYFKLSNDTIINSDFLIIDKKGFDKKIIPTCRVDFFHDNYSEINYFSRSDIDTIYLSDE